MMKVLFKASSVMVRIPKLKITFPVVLNNEKINAKTKKNQMDLNDFNSVKKVIFDIYSIAQTTIPIIKKESQCLTKKRTIIPYNVNISLVLGSVR